MIPPLVGNAPTRESADVAGEGFADAMAAALVVPAMVGTATPLPAEGEAGAAVTTAVPAPAPFTAVADQVARLIPGAPTADPTQQGVEGASTPETSVGPTIEVPAPVTPDPVEGELVETTDEPVALIPDEEPAAPTTAQPSEILTADPTAVGANALVASSRSQPTENTDAPANPLAETTGTAPAPATQSAPTVTPDEPTEVATVPEVTQPMAPEATAEPHEARSDTPSDLTRMESESAEPSPHNLADTAPSERSTGGAAASASGRPEVPSSTLRRVEETIRRLENAPPPRSITVTVDDAGLHRVTVSLHADGVRLTVPDGASTDSSLVSELERALSSRGFDMSGQDRRHQQPEQDDAAGFTPTAPPTRRTDATGVRL